MLRSVWTLENCGDYGNLHWVGLVHVLWKREDIVDKRTETSCVIGFEGSR